MGLVEKLEKIILSKEKIRKSINNKLDEINQISQDEKIENYNTYIDSIETGGGEPFEYPLIEWGDRVCYNSNRNYNTELNNFLLDCFNYNQDKGIEMKNPYNSTFSKCDLKENIELHMNSKTLLKYKKDSIYYDETKDNFYYDLQKTFNGCDTIQNVYLKMNEDIPMFSYYLFNNNTNLMKIEIPFNIMKIINSNYMFASCTSLEEVPIIDLTDDYNMSYMFNSCMSLKEIQLQGRPSKINLTSQSTSSTINMSFMFYNCGQLKNIYGLDLTNMNNSSSYTQNMFQYTNKLTFIDFSNSDDCICPLDLSTTGLNSRELIMNTLRTLPESSEGSTITLKSAKLSTLTDDDIEEMMIKNYTLV